MDIQKYPLTVDLESHQKQNTFYKLMNNHHNPPTVSPVIANPLLCFGCKGTYCDRVSLEEHACPNVGYICTCGMVFQRYLDMKGHQLEHGDGELSRFLKNWNPVRRREPEKVLTTWGSFVQTKIDLPRHSNTLTGPTLNAAFLGVHYPRGTTVDLCRRFLPVVRLQTGQTFQRGKKFRCRTCRLSFHRIDQLIEHHLFHTKQGVYGCFHCGMLLISQMSCPTHHQCGTFIATPKTRFTVGKVLPRIIAENEGKTFFRCPWCPVAFQQEAQLRKHETSCRLGKNKIVNGLREKNMLCCSVCQGHFSSAKGMLEHLCPNQPNRVLKPSTQIGSKAHCKTPVVEASREQANWSITPQRHQEEEVTLRLLSSRNLKMCTYKPLDKGPTNKIIGEPLKLKGLEMAPIAKSLGMKNLQMPPIPKPAILEKDEMEMDDDCYVVESASTKAIYP
ncbi:hypothetical protein GJAV_G00005380 [Gymnothorax javanicus]|nr:hypothetical protein GJAV_G00005380 [Gymnothorax javanicus]